VCSETAPVRIDLLGRPGCHLCDDARVVVSRVADELGVGWEERDITAASAREQADYWDKIPVAFVDGAPVDFWRISETRLRSALAHPSTDRPRLPPVLPRPASVLPRPAASHMATPVAVS